MRVQRRPQRAAAGPQGAAYRVLAGCLLTAGLLAGCTTPRAAPDTTSLRLVPVRPLSAPALQESVRLVRHRLVLAGVRAPAVHVGGNALVVTVRTSDSERVADAGARNLVELRPVLSRSVITGGLCTTSVEDGRLTNQLTDGPVRACSADGLSSYTLGPTLLDSSGIVSARASRDPISGATNVYLTCAPDAGARLAAETVAHPDGQLAIEVDGKVIGTPDVGGPITEGIAEITGSFGTGGAEHLARLLAGGVLPSAFTVHPAPVR